MYRCHYIGPLDCMQATPEHCSASTRSEYSPANWISGHRFTELTNCDAEKANQIRCAYTTKVHKTVLRLQACSSKMYKAKMPKPKTSSGGKATICANCSWIFNELFVMHVRTVKFYCITTGVIFPGT